MCTYIMEALNGVRWAQRAHRGISEATRRPAPIFGASDAQRDLAAIAAETRRAALAMLEAGLQSYLQGQLGDLASKLPGRGINERFGDYLIRLEMALERMQDEVEGVRL